MGNTKLRFVCWVINRRVKTKDPTAAATAVAVAAAIATVVAHIHTAGRQNARFKSHKRNNKIQSQQQQKNTDTYKPYIPWLDRWKIRSYTKASEKKTKWKYEEKNRTQYVNSKQLDQKVFQSAFNCRQNRVLLRSIEIEWEWEREWMCFFFMCVVWATFENCVMIDVNVKKKRFFFVIWISKNQFYIILPMN